MFPLFYGVDSLNKSISKQILFSMLVLKQWPALHSICHSFSAKMFRLSQLRFNELSEIMFLSSGHNGSEISVGVFWQSLYPTPSSFTLCERRTFIMTVFTLYCEIISNHL